MPVNKMSVVLFFVSFGLGLLVSCTVVDRINGNEHRGYYGEGEFSIDTSSIVESISNGNADVFVSMPSSSQSSSIATGKPVRWSQENYLLIANALYQYVWNRPANDWNLNLMQFSVDCKLVDYGPQTGYFSFWEIFTTQEGRRRVEHQIYIKPLKNSVNWYEIQYHPVVVDWPKINVDELNVSAIEALTIAEDAGGRLIRLTVENKCMIIETLAPRKEGNPYIWTVQYTDNYAVSVDAITGKVR
ncbi:MAG: hypothetical protein HFACDABA_01991 [Anaerolineales bacterium]|nr:hypothetical protein [Anaerolineales bacterium]